MGAGLLLMATGAGGAVNVTLLVGGAARAGVQRLAHSAAMINVERDVFTVRPFKCQKTNLHYRLVNISPCGRS